MEGDGCLTVGVSYEALVAIWKQTSTNTASGVGDRSFVDDMPALWMTGVHSADRVDLLRESSGFSGAAKVADGHAGRP